MLLEKVKDEKNLENLSDKVSVDLIHASLMMNKQHSGFMDLVLKLFERDNTQNPETVRALSVFSKTIEDDS